MRSIGRSVPRAHPSLDPAACRRAGRAFRSRIPGPPSVDLERQPPRSLRRDDTGVDTEEAEPAEEPRVLDLHAAVRDDLEPRLAGALLGRFVDDADLRHVLGLAKDVDHVDPLGNVEQARITLFAEDLRVRRVHGNHAVTVLLEVLRREEARTKPL